jgi:predicted dehydrogenase
VHNADLMQYYMGDARQVYARLKLWEPIRFKPTTRSSVSDFYQHWYAEMPDSIQATAEDTLVSVIDFEDGTIGQWTILYAAHGQGFGTGIVYGSQGSLRVGGIRNGVPPVLHMDDEGEIAGQALLQWVPDFHLDEIAARLFGSERPASYNLPFAEADRKLLAIEYHEFGACVLKGQVPEVDGLVGRRDVALCYAAFESSVLNRPVTLEEVESGQVGSYEAEIHAH